MVDRLGELLRAGMTDQEIAKDLGLKKQQVSDKLCALRKAGPGYEKRIHTVRPRSWTPEEVYKLVCLHDDRWSRVDIAAELGRTIDSSNSKIKELREKGVLERINLDGPKVAEEIEELLLTHTMEEIGEIYGRKRSAVKSIMKRHGVQANKEMLRNRVVVRHRSHFDHLSNQFPELIELSKVIEEMPSSAMLDSLVIGDGSITPRGELDIVHTCHQVEWVLVKYFTLWRSGVPCRIRIKKRSPCSPTPGTDVRVMTLQEDFIRDAEKRWYQERKKVLPSDFRLDPISLLVLYLDDGYFQEGNIGFATHNFSRDDNSRLASLMESDFGLSIGEPRLNKKKRSHFLLTRDCATAMRVLKQMSGELRGVSCFYKKFGEPCLHGEEDKVEGMLNEIRSSLDAT